MAAPPMNKDLKGWLRRKGRRMNTWSRRWVVLKDKLLFMFIREEDTKPSTCIPLDGQIVVEPPLDPNDPRRGYFDLVTETDKSAPETLSLCAETEEEKKIWVCALKKVLYAEKGGALFCQSLEEILYWERNAGRNIPYIVDECVEYLYKYGLDVEGIFRLPGRQSAIKDIISRFERGEKIKFEDEGTDVHVVASVIKTFLRDLPDSVIPANYFQKYMNIALRFMEGTTDQQKEECVADLIEAVKLLPQDNYTILKYICRFLRQVGLNEPKNKMTMMSIGTVFGYNILRHIDKENSQLFLCTANLGQNLVYMLLHYFPKVFVLEYNEEGKKENNVPTADLLRMSRVIDVPSVIPDTSANLASIVELEGIDFSLSTFSSSSSKESKGSDESIKITEDHFTSLVPSKNGLPHDNSGIGDDSVFLSSAKFSYDKKKDLHLTLSDLGGVTRSQSTPSSPNAASGTPPVPPRRTKSRITRNRNVSDRRRPDVTVRIEGGEKSPRAPLTPEPVNSEDVLTALSRAKVLNHDSSTLSSTGTTPSSCADDDLVNTTTGITSEKPGPIMEREAAAIGDGKLQSLTNDLQIQVDTLKAQLIQEKERYKTSVTALKNQLCDIKEKYEHRIATMQEEFKFQKQELEKKLALEREASTNAVVDNVKLKEEIHKYHMQYGDLSS